ncbi:protein MpRWP1 [Marchantia polymorpha subsp. ruderalis]|uniref:RWP-RK domain-containing protein n=2 Tax=Marchantia polymorpha TaxID=3197 RepID=A0AAF6B2G0_MARPO|nr:hypothetical protein MARPO_0049s0118 [Marchantia polymorpha]BBN06194.1 hypothetical protein Mp_3g19160 [Marchantia polymorpha subsp. ruderalis]|eukprot:PTQ38850.1 hypothetical protein MARPO_0049s0118 [Marchantia polymorpha]
MAGGQLGSPNCDGVVLNSFNSPRFDISEFLKTPKDSTSEEPFFNFAGFNIPTPTFNLLNPLPPFNSRRNPRGEGSEPDFSALLFDKGVESEGTSVDDTLNGELIAFDEIDADIAKDSFALFSGTHENFLNHPISPLRINVPYHSAGTRIPLNFPPPMFTQGSYLGGEPGGLMEVEDRALASMEHGASTSGGANPLMCPSTPMDWSMPREGALQTNSSQQHNTLQCDSCQILRRIIHSNGVQDTKLEIHGCDGQSYHAVLQTRFCIDDGFPATLEQQMVEFPVGNAEYVKQFLLQYSLLRRKEGFVLRHDSLSAGTEGSCLSDRVMVASAIRLPKQLGHSSLPDMLCTSSGQSKLHRSGSMDSGEHTETAMTPVKPPKSNAAAQRERTGKLKMSDLAQHFHLPINAAAKELGICPTVLKKICRRNGMRRWPHRKIKSIERIIATLEQTIAEGAGQGDEGIRMEIAMLRNERAQLCAGLLEGAKSVMRLKEPSLS